MGQAGNVQRGVLFFWFIELVVITVFVVHKFIINKIDPNTKEGDKYKQDADNKEKPKVQDGQTKPKQADKSAPKGEETMQELDKQLAAQKDKPVQGDSILQKIGKKIHNIVLFYLPLLIPFATNVITGTSYAFSMILYLAILAVLALFIQLKIQRTCVQNKIIKAILNNLFYILTFFFWVNQWGASTDSLPYRLING